MRDDLLNAPDAVPGFVTLTAHRRVVASQVFPDDGGEPVVFVTCDDGTVWRCTIGHTRTATEWTQIAPPIPTE